MAVINFLCSSCWGGLQFFFPQKNGHNEDILCVVQCPPSLLATSSYDGEIIVWNVISGRIQCRFVSPHSTEHQDAEGDSEASKLMMNLLYSVKTSVTRTLHLSLLCRTGYKCSKHHFPEEPQVTAVFLGYSSPVFWAHGSVLCTLLIITHDRSLQPSTVSFNTVLIAYFLF